MVILMSLWISPMNITQNFPLWAKNQNQFDFWKFDFTPQCLFVLLSGEKIVVSRYFSSKICIVISKFIVTKLIEPIGLVIRILLWFNPFRDNWFWNSLFLRKKWTKWDPRNGIFAILLVILWQTEYYHAFISFKCACSR